MTDVETLLDEIETAISADVPWKAYEAVAALRTALQSVKVEAKHIAFAQDKNIDTGEPKGAYEMFVGNLTKEKAEAIRNLLTGGENGPSVPK